MNTKTKTDSELNVTTPFHEAVETYLESCNIEFSVERFRTRAIYRYFVLSEVGDHEINMEIFIKPYSDMFAMYAYAPITVETAHRPELLDIFATKNFDFEQHKLELNPDTGAVRCGYASFLFDECVTLSNLASMQRIASGMIGGVMPLLTKS